jgi:hypothetical protein
MRLLSHGDGAIDYDAIGRINETLLTRTLPFNDYDFYLCGPTAFTQSIYDSLRRLNVSVEINRQSTIPRSWLISLAYCRTRRCSRDGTCPANALPP